MMRREERKDQVKTGFVLALEREDEVLSRPSPKRLSICRQSIEERTGMRVREGERREG